MLDQEKCWESVVKRESDQDGKFFFGVLTTGVYCRPSCPARRPLRGNVRFYESPAEAQREGLRACLRCRPLASVGSDPNTERIQALCRYIENNSDSPLKLEGLAARAGLSVFHLQRSFKAIVGVSAKQYMEAIRLKKLKASLKTSKDVTAFLRFYSREIGIVVVLIVAVASLLGKKDNPSSLFGSSYSADDPVEANWNQASPIWAEHGMVALTPTNLPVVAPQSGNVEKGILDILNTPSASVLGYSSVQIPNSDLPVNPHIDYGGVEPSNPRPTAHAPTMAQMGLGGLF